LVELYEEPRGCIDLSERLEEPLAATNPRIRWGNRSSRRRRRLAEREDVRGDRRRGEVARLDSVHPRMATASMTSTPSRISRSIPTRTAASTWRSTALLRAREARRRTRLHKAISALVAFPSFVLGGGQSGQEGVRGMGARASAWKRYSSAVMRTRKLCVSAARQSNVHSAR
jgi:hypothetical protein